MEQPVGSCFIVRGIAEDNIYGLRNNGIYKVVDIKSKPIIFVVVRVDHNGLQIDGEVELEIDVDGLNNEQLFEYVIYVPMVALKQNKKTNRGTNNKLKLVIVYDL